MKLTPGQLANIRAAQARKASPFTVSPVRRGKRRTGPGITHFMGLPDTERLMRSALSNAGRQQSPRLDTTIGRG